MEAVLKKPLTDELLIHEIVNRKNTDLFGVLYNRYSQLVYSKCCSFAKNSYEAEDLTHDIFLRLFVNLKKFKGNAKFSTWLYSFTYNFCVDYLQRNAHKKRERITVVKDKIKDEDVAVDIEDRDLMLLKTERLGKALQQIDAKDKAILMMKYQDEMSVKEIQELLKIGQIAVKMRLKRAKSRLIEKYRTISV